MQVKELSISNSMHPKEAPMVERFDIHRSIPFSLKHSSKHNTVLALADDIWNELPVDKKMKVDLKKQCLIASLVNLKIGLKTLNYICYSRTKEYYSKLPSRYKNDFFTYNIMKGVLSGLDDIGITNTKLGFINLEDNTTRRTKVKVAESFIGTLQQIQSSMIEDIQPPELIILKSRGEFGEKIDYVENDKTIKMRNELIAYNELRQVTKFTLEGTCQDSLLQSEKDFMEFNSMANSVSDRKFNLRNPYIYRVFNESFNLGGRYYNGIESNMSSELRTHLYINGNETSEKDFSCMHIRMLYNREGLELIDDAYDMLAKGNKDLRDLYKLAALVSINSSDKHNALNGIRNEIRELNESRKKNIVESKKKNYNLIKLFPDLTDKSINYYYEKWVAAHPKISKYLNSDIGIKLQNKDSKISSGVIKHFTSKGIPVLVIHDSFIVEKRYEGQLEEIMEKEYYKQFKFKPVIK